MFHHISHFIEHHDEENTEEETAVDSVENDTAEQGKCFAKLFFSTTKLANKIRKKGEPESCLQL